MAEKFLTTGRKKQIASVGLGISAWHVLTMGTNPLNIPALPAFISAPLVAGISLLFVAGAVTAWTVIMLWTEY